MPVSQPAKETAEGAQAMIDDDFSNASPKPDVVLGQRQTQIPCGNNNKKDKSKSNSKGQRKVRNGREGTQRVGGKGRGQRRVSVGSAGVLSSRPRVVTSAGDSMQIRRFGRGAHGSMPQASIDPVVMADSALPVLKPTHCGEAAMNGAPGTRTEVRRKRCQTSPTPCDKAAMRKAPGLGSSTYDLAAIASCFYGRPPFLPFSRAASFFAVLLELPPRMPIRLASQRSEPKTPSSRDGRYKSASSFGKCSP